MNLLLIGAQGSGKGTQAEKLSQALGIAHVASGDLFRKACDEKTELGIQAKAYMDRGELVPESELRGVCFAYAHTQNDLDPVLRKS